MDIQALFERSTGKWVSQRTSHHLLANKSESARSDLMVEALAKDDPAVVQLCQQQGFEPALVVSSLKMSWKSIIPSSPSPQVGSSVLVAVADAENPHQGTLISQVKPGQLTQGRYSMGDDEVLTLITETDALHSEERIWFAGPNFRLRTGVVKRSGGFEVASFCSEIRLGDVPTAAASGTAEAKS